MIADEEAMRVCYEVRNLIQGFVALTELDERGNVIWEQVLVNHVNTSCRRIIKSMSGREPTADEMRVMFDLS